jgi:hypothetical protein
MQIEELKKMAYMEGFIEDFLDDGLAKLTEAGAVKHADELKAAWLVLTAGIAKLRQENQNLQNCLQTARQALNT